MHRDFILLGYDGYDHLAADGSGGKVAHVDMLMRSRLSEHRYVAAYFSPSLQGGSAHSAVSCKASNSR